jgi:Ras-related C3 botulinum toxin substrate 1
MPRVGYDHDIKLVVVGDGGVGKTSLLVSYTHNYFPGDYIPTVFEHYTANVIWGDNKIVRLSLWDTAGQEGWYYSIFVHVPTSHPCNVTDNIFAIDYDKLRPMSYPNTNVFMVCYSTVDPETAANVRKKWIPEIRQYVPNAPIVLVGTKIDMREHRSVVLKLQEKRTLPLSKEEGALLRKELKLDGFWECSALTKKGLREVFDECIRVVAVPKDKRSKKYKRKKAKNWKKKCVLM